MTLAAAPLVTTMRAVRPLRRSQNIITTERQLKEVAAAYQDFDAFAYDFETMGEKRNDPRHAVPVWLSLAGPGRADVIPFGHPLGDLAAYEIPMTKDGTRPLKNRKPIPKYADPPGQLPVEVVAGMLEPIFAGPACKVGHGLKFDLEVADKLFGFVPPPPYSDTMISSFLINETHLGGSPYSLGACTVRELKYIYDKSLGRIGVEKFPFSEAANYSWHDSKYTWLLDRRYRRQIEEAGLEELYALEMGVLECVVWMEQAGVEIDVEGLDALDRQLTAQLEATYEKVRSAAGWDINLNANAQIIRLVFEERGHEAHPYYVTKVKKEPQVSAAALQATAKLRRDPVVKDILHWLDLHKLHSTYVLAIKTRLNGTRLHADFDQRGARTGRFSCRTPNLQNIPTRKSKEIRDLFVAPPGYKLIVADYSQIELRILAHYTKDPLLIAAYNDGLDLHTMTARRAYHIPEDEEPSGEQRARAKNCNFSMAYGAMAQTLVERYGVPNETEAQALIDAFFGTYKRVDPWRRAVVRRCKATRIRKAEAAAKGIRPQEPYVTTILGRRRHLPDIDNPYDFKRQRAAERQAVNTKIQGSAGDILKIAMVDLYRALRDTSAVLMLTVHDELVTQVPEDEVEETAKIVKSCMENVKLPVPLRVPLIADVKICDRWSEK
ncbi:MAG TPA: DNA polymerase [Gemmatimonadales bacterium]|nr:DNA polymerase [Gemmatimonadales bacterium]